MEWNPVFTKTSSHTITTVKTFTFQKVSLKPDNFRVLRGRKFFRVKQGDKDENWVVMAEYCPFVFWLPMCPSTVHRYFDSLCVRVRCCLIPAHPVPPGIASNSGILGILVQNSFAVRQNHFHGLGNYWEVIFTHSYSRAPPWEFREFGNSGNSCAK